MDANAAIAAAITAGGVVLAACVPAYFVYRAKVKDMAAKLKMTEREIADCSDALSFAEMFAKNARFLEHVQNLCESSTIDRVLMFRAWNGASSPKWTTATWQYRLGDQTPISYVHTELDADYIERLSSIEDHLAGKNYTVADMPPSLIKSIYEVEGVTSSSWFFVMGCNHEDGARAVTYMSFASHEPDGISDLDHTRAQLLVDRLRGHALEVAESDTARVGVRA